MLVQRRKRGEGLVISGPSIVRIERVGDVVVELSIEVEGETRVERMEVTEAELGRLLTVEDAKGLRRSSSTAVE